VADDDPVVRRGSPDEGRGSLAPGALVGGRFKVERLIGRGGMGEVYAARHTQTGKEVALKLIHAKPGSGETQVRRFLREARAATAIEHPNVIEVFDVFEDADGTPVMVMELLRGEPFSRRIAKVGAFRLHEAAGILVPACRALQAAHAKGIVHRDLKPDNVFLVTTPAGSITKLLDFGIAKVLDPTKINAETQGQNTNTGSILGTPHYMSYEQAMSDKNVDHRCDVWSMGVMLFEALTGRRPLSYDTLGEMYTKLLQGTVPSIREFLPDAPADLADVVDHCLAKLPQDRLADIGALADVLEKYTDPDVPGARVGGQVIAGPVAPRSGVTGGASLAVSAGPLSVSTADRGARRPPRAALLLSAAGLAAVVGVGAFAVMRKAPASATNPPAAPASVAPSDSAPPTASTAVESPSTPPPSTASTALPPPTPPPLHSSLQHSPPLAPPSATHQTPLAASSASPSTPTPTPSATAAARPEGDRPPGMSSPHKGLPKDLPY
jgi:serine/threonine-protein kinase